jgi:beta-mannosidase
MRNLNLLILPLLITLSLIGPVTVHSQEPVRIDLGGSWKYRRAETSKWADAKVPGCIHHDLLLSGVITDPTYGDNEKNLQWIGETGWEYMRTFLVPDSVMAMKHIDLIFEGLDTYAKVYLNDSLILTADNMFRTWSVDIKTMMVMGANQLRIEFPAVTEEIKARYDKLKYRLPGDERVVCRKAAYQFGWDFCPKFITSGIWRPVYIKAYNYMNLLGVQYIQKKVTDSVAHVSAVFSMLADVSDSAHLIIKANGIVLADKWSGIRSGLNFVRLEFDIKNPKLWWSNGLGEPYLYPFQHEIYFAGRPVSKGTTRIGLRTIELIRSTDSIGIGFYFKLNGVPVFMKGANYIPQDNFLTNVKDTSYRSIIKDAVGANMNMLRVWGGGIYENNLFYDLCDENGILVWQDFMFANAMYPKNKEFLQSVQAEVNQNIVRLRNHACIAIWCGNNEIDEGWKNWGWQKQYGYSKEDSSEIWNNYRIMFWSMIPSAMAKLDTLGIYLATSPLIGWGHPESLKEGDSHYWGVWWGKEPFSNFGSKVGRFMTEYGFQGLPQYESFRKFIPGSPIKLDSPVMKLHDKSPDGLDIVDEYLNRNYNKPKDLKFYAYVSQLLQADGITMAIEAHRRAKPWCGGSLFWQFNDCWPGITWSARDYYGAGKALLFALKDAYSPLLISPVFEKGNVAVHVVSDKLQDIKAVLRMDLMTFTGKSVWKKEVPVTVSANSSHVYFQEPLEKMAPGMNRQNHLLSCMLVSGKDTLARKILYFDIPKNLKLDSVTVQRKFMEIPEGLSVELHADRLAKNVFLSSPFAPGEFSDNYFDMLPGETRTVIFSTKAKNPAAGSMMFIGTLYDSFKQ